MGQEIKNNGAAQEDVSQVVRVRQEKLRALKEQGKNPFEIVKFDRTADSKEILDHFEELEGSEAAIAGRIISKRVMGKASFFHIMDGAG